MSLVYITGASGVGKSTVKDALKARGYQAYDTDENGLTAWINKDNGQPTQRSNEITEQTAYFLRNHDWIMDREKVIVLKASSQDGTVFLCGVTSNDVALNDLFDYTVCLTVDEPLLKQRLATRTSNDFGKSEDELNDILSWHKLHEEKYRNLGAKMIDASQSVEKIVGEVLSFVGE